VKLDADLGRSRLRPEHRESVLHERVQIARFAARLPGIREAAHPLYDIGGAIDTPEALVNDLVALHSNGVVLLRSQPLAVGERLHVLAQQGQIRSHERQGVVDLVGQAGRQLAHRRQARLGHHAPP